MDKCPNCGSYDAAQEGSSREGYLILTCCKCGDRRFFESYRDEGQDKWRDREDEEYG